MDKITRRRFLQGLAAIGLIRLPEIDLDLPTAEPELEELTALWDGEDNSDEFPYSQPSTRSTTHARMQNGFIRINGGDPVLVLDYSMSFSNAAPLVCNDDPGYWNPLYTTLPEWDADVWAIEDLGIIPGDSVDVEIMLPEGVSYKMSGHLDSAQLPWLTGDYDSQAKKFIRHYCFSGYTPIKADRKI